VYHCEDSDANFGNIFNIEELSEFVMLINTNFGAILVRPINPAFEVAPPGKRG